MQKLNSGLLEKKEIIIGRIIDRNETNDSR